MAKLLPHGLVAGLRWETLIGLEKESVEIRALAARRDADQFVVVGDDDVNRTVGLAKLPAEALAPASGKPRSQPMPYVSLAAALCRMLPSENAVFLCPDPEARAECLFVTIRDGRPDRDEVLSIAAAHDAARRFIEANETGSTIVCGVVSQPIGPAADAAANAEIGREAREAGNDIWDAAMTRAEVVTLAQIAEFVRRAGIDDYRLSPVNQAPSLRLIGIGVAIVAVVAVVIAGGWWWWSARAEAERLRIAQSQRVDPVQAYRDAVRKALAREPFDAGSAFAQAVQTYVHALPANASGWRPESIVCKAAACDIQWRRLEGGTFDKLLAQRERAVIVDINSATETMPLTLDGAPEASRVSPVPLSQFLRTAGARLQQLGDYGLDISMTMAAPIVPVPPALAKRADIAPPILKGTWQISGHLAFLDSVKGLMQRSANLSLAQVEVQLNDEKPVFSAQGAFYVH
ncbi:hypothetical protein PTE30175_01191 [Pandoraea terrae]|uniref:Uncharacterized protein n=1 Tax=Pandoraea terrae TaxID=1537710 RepID=A0A5E4T7E5_9BURK|nr:type 4b pilus protein PilO2 [Pandoraea terrae]VVD83795.1 hypothetical protein PTE30175_01191 [Pandoraea terrae]